MIQCQACGTENPDDATYCVKCARRLDPVTQQAVVEQRAQHTARGWNTSAIVVAVLILLIIVALVLAFAVFHL